MAGPSGQTPVLHLPYPTDDDNVDVARDIKALADKLEAGGEIPVGCLMMWPTNAPPAGWLVCNGQQVPATTYPQLATLLGQTGGNVTLPDMRGRLAVGVGTAQGDPTATAKTLLIPGGAERVKLTGNQSGIPVHNHNLAIDNASPFGSQNAPVSDSSWGMAAIGVAGGPYFALANTAGSYITWNQAVHGHTGTATQTAATAALQDHENMPPFLAVNFIIRAG